MVSGAGGSNVLSEAGMPTRTARSTSLSGLLREHGLHLPPGARPVLKLSPAGIDDKTALSKSGETPARERVTRRTRALDCGSTHRWSGCVSFITIVSRHPEHQRGHRPAQRASGQALSRRVQKHKRTQDPRAGAFRIRGA